MADRKQQGKQPLSRPLARLADQLSELDESLEAGQQALRRLSIRIATANRHRGRLLSLGAALLRRRHGEALRALGAEALDVAEAEVDTIYDGLLIALVRAARAAGRPVATIVLAGRASRFGTPSFAAELLGATLRPAATAAEAAAAPLEKAALVADARELLAEPGLHDSLAGRAALLVALLDLRDPDGVAILRAEAAALIERLGAAGLEVLHVSGGGDQIAFAPRGLLAPGRADGLSAGRA